MIETMSPRRALLLGALTVGVLDIFDAFVFFGFRGVPPLRILQAIASGVLGREAAAEGGLGTAALGLLLHFFIAFMVVLVFYLVSRKVPILTRYPLVTGAALWYRRVLHHDARRGPVVRDPCRPRVAVTAGGAERTVHPHGGRRDPVGSIRPRRHPPATGRVNAMRRASARRSLLLVAALGHGSDATSRPGHWRHGTGLLRALRRRQHRASMALRGARAGSPHDPQFLGHLVQAVRNTPSLDGGTGPQLCRPGRTRGDDQHARAGRFDPPVARRRQRRR